MQNSSANMLRTIRSFVRREGRMTSSQQRAFDSLWPLYGVITTHQTIDFNQLFQRVAPVILEIGFGMGHSLVQQAQQFSENNYLGIEVHRPGVGALLSAIEKNKLENIRIVCDDAVAILKNNIADNSLDKIQIFFPDPWPKKRHHKRRLIQIEFVELLRTKLKPGGYLQLATDWQDYAAHMLQVMQKSQGWKNLAVDNQFIPRPVDRPLTKFEQRGKRLGHGVWDLLFEHVE